MDEREKIKALHAMVDDIDEGIVYADEMLSVYLLAAGEAILLRAFPFGGGDGAVPSEYSLLQVEIAAYLVNKRGAEGEISHSENGVSRSYESGEVPPSLLRRVVPLAGAVT